jgi:hypothetical protein
MKTLINKELYESYKKENDKLLEQICQYEDDNSIPWDVVQQYKKISHALIDYEHAYHPLPGRASTIIQRKTTAKFESLELV